MLQNRSPAGTVCMDFLGWLGRAIRARSHAGGRSPKHTPTPPKSGALLPQTRCHPPCEKFSPRCVFPLLCLVKCYTIPGAALVAPLFRPFTSAWETGGWGYFFLSQVNKPPSARTRTGAYKANPQPAHKIYPELRRFRVFSRKISAEAEK